MAQSLSQSATARCPARRPAALASSLFFPCIIAFSLPSIQALSYARFRVISSPLSFFLSFVSWWGVLFFIVFVGVCVAHAALAAATTALRFKGLGVGTPSQTGLGLNKTGSSCTSRATSSGSPFLFVLKHLTNLFIDV